MAQTLTRIRSPIADEGALSIKIKFEPVVKMTDEIFEPFCALNYEMRIGRTVTGTVEIVPPAFGYTGNRNIKISAALENWASQDANGLAFDSSTGFTLPNGAVRSPDASLFRLPRYGSLTDEERDSFIPMCPNFVVELRSRSDSLSVLQSKMDEYMVNDARLGWLLDPLEWRAPVYRPGAHPETPDNPAALFGSPELPCFTLDLKPIWEPVS